VGHRASEVHAAEGYAEDAGVVGRLRIRLAKATARQARKELHRQTFARDLIHQAAEPVALAQGAVDVRHDNLAARTRRETCLFPGDLL
jgi:hypothetical protein